MSSDDHNARVQSQFGASAEHYRTSASHARGASLARLRELVQPRGDWLVLDAATGAGHTAAALAPGVRAVVAGDLTREMLEQARLVCREQGRDNVFFVRESAQALSYRAGVFDLVTCRVAAHHFPQPERFAAECARVLKPGGLLAVVDNVVPDDTAAADWINDFERRRDPGHARCLSLARWRRLLADHHLETVHVEVNPKWFDYEDWMNRMNVPGPETERLAGALLDAPRAVRAFWRPMREAGRVRFALQEAIIIARRAP